MNFNVIQPQVDRAIVVSKIKIYLTFTAFLISCLVQVQWRRGVVGQPADKEGRKMFELSKILPTILRVKIPDIKFLREQRK